ncbi:MAG: hypothetical protein ACXWLX_09350 [Rhizomicrobium sp.]
MAGDLIFPHCIRTNEQARAAFPLFLETVEQSIDHVQELPRHVLGLEHWNKAFLALWAAVDFPADGDRLACADAALCKALSAEGWLAELRLH